MHIDEIDDLLSSSNIFQMTKPRKKVGRSVWQLTGEISGAYRVLVGKPEKIRPLGRPWPRGECRAKIDKKCKIRRVN
jgi:hypothetical protein